MKVRKLLICAAALSGFAAQASAADLSDVVSAKDPLPDTLSYHGVTIYGTVDVGYAYQSHGLPESGAFYPGLDYDLQKISGGSVSTLTNNALEQSKVGLKIEEQIGLGFMAIGKLEANFDPASGELADACASVLRASNYGTAGKNGNIDAYTDGSRCGQAFAGQAYAGLSNPLYGTLTIGRQSSLVNDGVGAYDPVHGSYAFSLIGFSGGAAGGIGSTETARWDNAVKYIFTYGPAHVAAMYSSGGQDTPIFGDAYGADVGLTYKGFAIDGYYTKENGAAGVGISTTANDLAGTITNNEAYSVMGKYTFEFGDSFKDESPSSKLTLFAGYVHTEMSNPDHTQGYYNGWTTQGGYPLVTANVVPGGYNLFGSDKELDTEWGGATYEMGPWSFTGAYYHESQNSYLAIAQKTGGTLTAGGTYTCAQASGSANVTSGTTTPAKVTAASNCSGDIDFGSFVVDYKFNKHFDVYTGVSIAENSGGLAAGYINTETVNFVSGLRLKF